MEVNLWERNVFKHISSLFASSHLWSLPLLWWWPVSNPLPPLLSPGLSSGLPGKEAAHGAGDLWSGPERLHRPGVCPTPSHVCKYDVPQKWVSAQIKSGDSPRQTRLFLQMLQQDCCSHPDWRWEEGGGGRPIWAHCALQNFIWAPVNGPEQLSHYPLCEATQTAMISCYCYSR